MYAMIMRNPAQVMFLFTTAVLAYLVLPPFFFILHTSLVTDRGLQAGSFTVQHFMNIVDSLGDVRVLFTNSMIFSIGSPCAACGASMFRGLGPTSVHARDRHCANVSWDGTPDHSRRHSDHSSPTPSSPCDRNNTRALLACTLMSSLACKQSRFRSVRSSRRSTRS